MKSKVKNYKSHIRGFTLIELMVATSIFIIVMFFSMTTILSTLSVNRKSANLRSVMDNLNLAMDSMTRTIRFGTDYHCGTAGDTSTPVDCGSPGLSSITVRAANGSHITYVLSGTRVARTVCPASGVCGSALFVTSSDMVIQKLSFIVLGSSYSDTIQPRVVIVVAGYTGAQTSTRSYFSLEATVSQKMFDFHSP